MMKTCVILDGQVIHIGEWDYQVESVEVEPAEYDEEGNVTKEAVYEDQAMNPLPEGATIEQRDFEYSDDRGWYEVGTVEPPSVQERIDMLENTILFLLGGM